MRSNRDLYGCPPDACQVAQIVAVKFPSKVLLSCPENRPRAPWLPGVLRHRTHTAPPGNAEPSGQGSGSRPGAIRATRAPCPAFAPSASSAPARPAACGRAGHPAPAAARNCRVPRCRALQPGQALLQLRHPPGQRRVLCRQQRDELALQGDQRITGSIHRPGGHRPPSSGHPGSNQGDTLSRPAGTAQGFPGPPLPRLPDSGEPPLP